MSNSKRNDRNSDTGRVYMLTLWFTSGEQCRKACDVLSIDKRNVNKLSRRYSEDTGHFGFEVDANDNVTEPPLTHTLRFRESLMDDAAKQFKGRAKRDQLLTALGHCDDEVTW